MSHPTARHQKPSRRSHARPDRYDELGSRDGPYQVAVCDEVRGDDAPYEEVPFEQAFYDQARYQQARYERAFYDQTPYGQAFFDQAPYQQVFSQAPYQQTFHAQVPYQQALHTQAPYQQGFHAQAPYEKARYDGGTYEEARYDEAPHEQTRYGGTYEEAWYDGGTYEQARYDAGTYEEARYDGGTYEQAWYDEARYDGGTYEQARYDEARYDEAAYDEARYDEAAYDDGRRDRPASDGPSQPRKPGAHRHSRPPRKRRKPVRVAAALAGSTLLVAGAAPAAAHWWHRPATHPDALDQESLPAEPGAQVAGKPVAPQNALDQWAQIPIGKHAAAEVSAAKRAARRAAAQPSHAPQPQPQPRATQAPAYQNPLREVSDLVLERIDMGVDFGGAGPVFALGDGVITNATGDSSGWPGGGWITYQLTDGPDAGLVVYLAEDATPTVQVGQKVTSSTVIANMFNGGDGIETGWATADSSTAESQMAAAGGISGGGPFPTMVGLSFDAVLESVGVPAAPNANEAGNGMLPAGYPPT